MSYTTPAQARLAGAVGTDTQLADAIADAEDVIDRYCRDRFEPTQMMIKVAVDVWGWGYLPVRARSVDIGTLDPDGRGWQADGMPPFGLWQTSFTPPAPPVEYLINADAGWDECPAAVASAAARLVALYCPAPFTAQADAEGNPIGRPPAPTMQDESDPAPPTLRQGTPDPKHSGIGPERTTGDPVADAWLEPYKQNRVLI